MADREPTAEELLTTVFPETLTEEQLWALSLASRTERLAKLVKLKAPKVIIAHETILVMKAVAGALPEEWGRAFGRFMQGASRRDMNRCTNCGGRYDEHDKDATDGWCAACMKQVREEFANDEDGERPDAGGTGGAEGE